MIAKFSQKESLLSKVVTLVAIFFFTVFSSLAIGFGWKIGWVGLPLGLISTLFYVYHINTKILVCDESKVLKWVIFGFFLKKIDLNNFVISEVPMSDYQDGTWNKCVKITDGKTAYYFTDSEWDDQLIRMLLELCRCRAPG